ncbi:MAG: hypothetical protein LBI53_08275 [Candidatus Peribacteria bacterium]|jgi:hypothetical protein|nr:hypothetical protein [Candidatus Peribacteria bacterium]
MKNERNKEIWSRYSERSLRERYKNACNLAGYLYFLFISDKATSISETKRVFLKHRCSDLVEQRIENEAVYVNVIQTKKSNDLLAENIHQYMNIYLSKRLIDLQATIETIQAKLLRVVRAIEGIVKECV